MSRFNDVLRKAIFVCNYRISSLSSKSLISRQTIYTVMHGAYKPRRNTARALALAVIEEIHSKAAEKKHEIDELKHMEKELRKAYNDEYGAGEDDDR